MFRERESLPFPKIKTLACLLLFVCVSLFCFVKRSFKNVSPQRECVEQCCQRRSDDAKSKFVRC